ncbi:MAG: RDD family protein [Brevundimonas sp.]|nr:MAG: RDD family protein [Brevundimonas sp.]
MSATDFSQRAALKARRSLITPEGVDLNLELASLGERFTALVIDLAILLGVTIVFSVAAGFALSGTGRSGEIVGVIWLLGLFFLRNGYFLLMEMSARGASFGKRAMKIRVAARDGGRLQFPAVFARNALRELEVFLPIGIAIGAPFQGGDGGWVSLLSVIWIGVFVSLPFFNRDKLRAGDLVAGTWVVKAPRQKIMRDMADAGAAHRTDFAFTPTQLDAYGVKELQVLEQVLRTGDRATVRAVSDRIATKIGYDRGSAADIEFLRAYYHAIRERLESGLLMGRRRRDKFDIGR